MSTPIITDAHRALAEKINNPENYTADGDPIADIAEWIAEHDASIACPNVVHKDGADYCSIVESAVAELRQQLATANEELVRLRKIESYRAEDRIAFNDLRDRNREQEQQLAAANSQIVEQREQLVLCFTYLGKEIERLTLNESAESGVQSLSRSIASVLDKTPTSVGSDKPAYEYDGEVAERAADLWKVLASWKGEDADAQRIIERALKAEQRGELIPEASKLIEIVEGVRSQRWVGDVGGRLKDTHEWCAFYVAFNRVGRAPASTTPVDDAIMTGGAE